MDCKMIAERLPWVLNGTLEGDEQRRIGDHLTGCESCRDELRETLFAGKVFGQHLPSEVLIDIAFGRPPQHIDRSLIERHLELCGDCAQELELARESHQLALQDLDSEPQPTVVNLKARRPLTPSTWRRGAIAASLTAMVAAGGWLTTITRLEDRIAELEAPRLNVWIGDVSAVDANQRGTSPLQVEVLNVPAEATEILLLLHKPAGTTYPSYEIDMVAAGEPQWTQAGLELQLDNVFTLSLRPELVPASSFELRIYGVTGANREEVATYSISIRHH